MPTLAYCLGKSGLSTAEQDWITQNLGVDKTVEITDANRKVIRAFPIQEFDRLGGEKTELAKQLAEVGQPAAAKGKIKDKFNVGDTIEVREKRGSGIVKGKIIAKESLPIGKKPIKGYRVKTEDGKEDFFPEDRAIASKPPAGESTAGEGEAQYQVKDLQNKAIANLDIPTDAKAKIANIIKRKYKIADPTNQDIRDFLNDALLDTTIRYPIVKETLGDILENRIAEERNEAKNRPKTVSQTELQNAFGPDAKPFEAKTKNQKTLAGIIKGLGWNVKFVDSLVGVNGAVLPSDQSTFYINVNASRPMMSVAGHEIMHLIEKNYPDLYKLLTDSLNKNVVDFPEWVRLYNKRRVEHGHDTVSDEVARKELFSDFAGESFLKADTWKAMARENPTLTAKLIEIIKMVIDKISRAIKRHAPTSIHFTNIETLRKVVGEVAGAAASRKGAKITKTKGGVAFQLKQPGAVWYSQMEEVLAHPKKGLPKSSTPANMKKMVNAWSNKFFKEEELAWSGLNEYFDEQKGKVTKQQIMDWLAENNTVLEEVVGETVYFTKKQQDLLEKYENERFEVTEMRDRGGQISADRAKILLVEINEKYMKEHGFSEDDLMSVYTNSLEARGRQSDTKWSEHTTPGGENYRELHLTLPVKEKYRYEKMPGWEVVIKNEGEPDSVYKRYESKQEAETVAKQNNGIVRPATLRVKEYQKRYTSPHYDESNIVVTMRFDERNNVHFGTATIRSVHGAEFQSDWASEIRKKGVKKEFKKEDELKVVRAKLARQLKKEDYWGYENGLEVLGAIRKYDDFASRWETTSESKALANKYRKLEQEKLAAKIGTVDVPFKKSYYLVALKRMVQWAVQNGFDAVTWDKGAVHFKRWGSQKIAWKKAPAATPEMLAKIKRYGAEWKKYRQEAISRPQINDKYDYAEDTERVAYIQKWLSKNAHRKLHKGGWLVEVKEQVGGEVVHEGQDIDIEAMADARELGERQGKLVKTKAELRSMIDKIARRNKPEYSEANYEAMVDARTEKTWKRMQNEDVGVSLPRKESFENIYDQEFTILNKDKKPLKSFAAMEEAEAWLKTEKAKDVKNKTKKVKDATIKTDRGIVINEANKFFNKKTWGFAKVGEAEINVPELKQEFQGRVVVDPETGAPILGTEEDFLHEVVLEKAASKTKVWHLPITDEMRYADVINKTASEGLPLFQVPGINDNMDKMDEVWQADPDRVMDGSHGIGLIPSDKKRMSLLRRVTGLPFWIAEKYPNIKKLVDAALASMKVRQQLIHEATVVRMKTFFSLRGDVADTTRRLILYGDIKGSEGIDIFKPAGPAFKILKSSIETIPERYVGIKKILLEKGFSEQVADAYVEQRRELDNIWVRLDEKMTASGVDASEIQEHRNNIQKLHNYFPHKGYGSKAVLIKDPTQKTQKGETYKTKGSAEGVIKRKGLGKTHKAFETGEGWTIKAKPGMENIIYYEAVPSFAGFVLKGNRKNITAKAVEWAHEHGHPEVTAKHVSFVSRGKMPDQAFFNIDLQAISQFIEQGLKRSEKESDTDISEHLKDRIFNSIAEEVSLRGFGQHTIFRKNIPGYETQDVKRVILDYIIGANSMMVKIDVAKELGSIMNKRDEHGNLIFNAKSNPEEYNFASNFVRDFLTNKDQLDTIVDNIRGVLFAKYLGLVIKTATLNLTQNMVAAWPSLTVWDFNGTIKPEQVNWAGLELTRAMKDTKRALVDFRHKGVTLKKKGMTPKQEQLAIIEEQYLYKQVVSGINQDQQLSEIRGNSRMQNPILNKVMGIMGLPMQMAEIFNRSSTSLAAFRIAWKKLANEKFGLAEADFKHKENPKWALEDAIFQARIEASEKHGERIVLKSHYLYGKANYPEFIRGTAIGKMLRPLYTFRTFTHNYGEMINDLMRQGWVGQKAALKSMGALFSLGGLMALPFYDSWDDAYKMLFGETPVTHARKNIDSQLMRDLVSYGSLGAMGVDLHGSLGIELPKNFTDILGVPWAVIEDSARMGADLKLHDYIRALEDAPFTPMVVRNAMSGYRQYTKGTYTRTGTPIGDLMGGTKEPRKLDFKDFILKAIFGFQGVSASKAYEAYRELTAKKKEVSDVRVRLAKKYVEAKRKGDRKEMRNIKQWLLVWNKEAKADGKRYLVIDLTKSIEYREKSRKPSVNLRGEARTLRDIYK